MTSPAYEHHEPSAPISVYTIRGGYLVAIADCREDDVVATLRQLREDGEIDDRSPVGIRDRDAHVWLANAYATGGRR